MLTIPVIIYIILIVFAVLQLILFFKIWGATNDIAKIKDAITRPNQTAISPSAPQTNASQSRKFNVGDNVESRAGQKMKIARINNIGEYVCTDTEGNIIGAFKEIDLL